MKELVQYTHSLLNWRLTPAQQRGLGIYEQVLLDWNTRMNLTAIQDVEQVRIKHFLDSFTCLLALRNTPMERVIDVGTGAGFPGIPLKIIFPAMRLTLVETVGKKAEFCRHVVAQLGLEGVEVVQDRAEALGQNPAYRQQFDWALARAVAILPVLVEYLLPLVKVGGAMLAMKGEGAPAEAQAAEKVIKLLGGHLQRLVQVNLPGVVEDRFLVVVDKLAATPPAYPRRVGVPSKKPLG